MPRNPKIGDIGTDIIVTIIDQDGAAKPVDTAVTMEILLRKPDGSTETLTATFAGIVQNGAGDGTDGKIYAASVASTFDQSGLYYAVGHVVFAGGSEFHTETGPFVVEDIFE
jgi:hypothetical protein